MVLAVSVCYFIPRVDASHLHEFINAEGPLLLVSRETRERDWFGTYIAPSLAPLLKQGR